MRITHQQIADKVGVSRTVVTHVLHRTPNTRINEQTRRDILRVAAELGYEPRNRATYNIGYVMSPSQMKLDAEISQVMRLEKILRSHGYRLMLTTWQDDNPELLKEAFNAKTVDAVILNIWRDGLVKTILPKQLPWILTSDEDGVDESVELIALDSHLTAKRLAQHLIENGHTRLGLVVGLPDIKFHRNIIAGTQQAMLEAGIDPESLQLIRPYYIGEIAADLLPLMAGPHAPTAFITTSPEITITTLYILQCSGHRVPEKVSMVALFDHERHHSLSPQMTSTDALGTEFIGSIAQRLLEKIQHPQALPQQVHIAGQIIERQSVAAPSHQEQVAKLRDI